ncbi:MAG: methylcrotonoyl-CoA carboxylase, partial [Comamonadaceae bacterium]
FEPPPGVRTDAGVASGSEISPHYDPMIAKLIAHGTSRAAALDQLAAALRATTVLGVTSNRAFLLELLADALVRANTVTTEFIDHWLAQRPTAATPPAHVAALSALWLVQQRQATPHAGAWTDPDLAGWRIARADAVPALTHAASGADGDWRIGFGPAQAGQLAVRVDDTVFRVAVPCAPGADWQTVTVDGLALRLRAHCDTGRALALLGDAQLSLDVRPLHVATRGAAGAHAGLVRAPMMGLVIAVDATLGQEVAAGQRLGTMESMKMEMAITAPTAGRVGWIGCAAQARVERHQELFRIEPAT